MRHLRRCVSRVLIVLVLLVLAVPVSGAITPAVAQTGASPVTAGPEWRAVDEGRTFEHVTLPNTVFMYMEHDLANLPVPDNLFLMEVATVMQFREAMGVESMPQLGTSDPAADPLWYLHSLDYDGVAHVVLFTVSVTAVPGKGAVEILITRPESLQAALTSAQQGITVYGAPALVARVDTTAVLTAGGGQAQVPAAPPQTTQQPTTQQPPAAPPQATQLTGSAVVGPDSIAYGGDWQYATDSSTAEAGLFQNTVNPQVIFGYFTMSGLPATDGLTALRQFNTGFFSEFTPGTVQEVITEALPSGHAWSLYIVNDPAGRQVYLTVADVSTPGALKAQVLVTPFDQLSTGLVSTQQSFQINGVGAFSELDPAYVASLAGAPPPVAGQAPTQQTGATTQPASGGVADYQALDAPTGCDGIGWVITDPSQAPATQADLDYRGACVGGATYIADCGLYEMETTPLVFCSVHVAVGGAPMNVSMSHFTLVDGAGAAYQVDTETAMLMVMLFGSPELPEAQVSPGTSVSGTLLFNVPATAPGPWTIQVAPETIAVTGEAPGTLVIDGALQPVDPFAQ
jgi:hypothetical protein